MRHTHPRSTTWDLFRLAALLAAFLLLSGLACGRRGDPRPRSDVSADLTPPPDAAPASPGR